MDLDQLKNGWKKSKKRIENNVHLNKEKMEAILKKQAEKTTHGLSRVFIMGIVVQSLTILFLVLDIFKYSEVTDLAIANALSIVMISFALYYSLNRFNVLKSTNYEVFSLSESLKKKIAFYKFSYNKWLLSFASSFVIFIWSINMLAGDFTSLGGFNIRILSVYFVCFLFIYFSNRYAHTKYLHEYEISLNDLGGSQLTDLKAESRKFRIFKLVLIIILTLILIFGIVVLVMN